MNPYRNGYMVESLRNLEVEKGDYQKKKFSCAVDLAKPMSTKKLRNKRDPNELSLPYNFVVAILVISMATSFYVGTVVRQHVSTRLGPTLGTWVNCDGKEDGLCGIRASKFTRVNHSDDEEDADSSMLLGSYGQHLLADVSTMDQDALVPAFLELASSKGWALKSHYGTNPESATCVLLFRGGHHMLIHKPSRQLDIFSKNDDSPLLDWLELLPMIGKWAFKPRATNTDPNVFDAGVSDLHTELLGSMVYSHKRLVAKELSDFQEVAIYDTVDPRIHASSKPDRQVFLDGVVQSRRHGERAYHEALVHPAMMMHPNPERVAIVGAGEGATLREVLKHSSVKQVIMIEIDATVMKMSRDHLPEWNDCSDLILPRGMRNPTGNCFDDPRALVFTRDAIRWFMDQYPRNKAITAKLFDVIIMDALDPGDKVEFSDMLFDNQELVATFHRALTDNGVLACQMGEQAALSDPNPLWTRDRHSVTFVKNMGKVGFRRMYDYNEGSTRFGGLWSFLVASKSLGAERWFNNPAQIDVELHKRAMPTKSGAWPFLYYDGATHASYQTTSRAAAVVACLYAPHLQSCQRGAGLPKGENIPAWEALTVENGVLIAQQDLEPGTYIGLEECVHTTWDIPHSSKILMDAETHKHIEIHMKSWKRFSFTYGAPSPMVGLRSKTVDMGWDAWLQDCRMADPTYERFQPGVADPMLDRFWRINECAERRKVHKRVQAGSKVDCITTRDAFLPLFVDSSLPPPSYA